MFTTNYVLGIWVLVVFLASLLAIKYHKKLEEKPKRLGFAFGVMLLLSFVFARWMGSVSPDPVPEKAPVSVSVASTTSWEAQQEGGWRDLSFLGPEWSKGYNPGN